MAGVAVAVAAGGAGRQRIMTSEENMKSKLLGSKTLIASFAFILIACAVPPTASNAARATPAAFVRKIASNGRAAATGPGSASSARTAARAIPRRVKRSRSRAFPRASRPRTEPSVQPSRAAACS